MHQLHKGMAVDYPPPVRGMNAQRRNQHAAEFLINNLLAVFIAVPDCRRPAPAQATPTIVDDALNIYPPTARLNEAQFFIKATKVIQVSAGKPRISHAA